MSEGDDLFSLSVAAQKNVSSSSSSSSSSLGGGAAAAAADRACRLRGAGGHSLRLLELFAFNAPRAPASVLNPISPSAALNPSR